MLTEIVSRRSIRAYLPREVSRADLETVLRAGTLAPSSKNRQPWRFTAALGAEKEAALAAMARGLEAAAAYRLSVRPVLTELAAFGSLVNMVSPIRIRPGSLAETAVRMVELPGEEEDFTATGDVLMTAGAWLRQGFSGTGFDRETRVMGDCGSRLYVLEQER